MNTGVQRSGATPPAARTATTQAVGPEPGNVFGQGKNVPLIAMAHEIPYVATATVADLRDLEAKVEQAMEFRGARYLHVLVPCPLGWGSAPGDTIKIARLADADRAVPGVRGRGRRGRRRHTHPPPAPVEEYLRLQTRYAHLFETRRRRDIARLQRSPTGNRRGLQARAPTDEHRQLRPAELTARSMMTSRSPSRSTSVPAWPTRPARGGPSARSTSTACRRATTPARRARTSSSGSTTPRRATTRRRGGRSSGQPAARGHGPGLLPAVRDRVQPGAARLCRRDQLGRAVPRRRGDPARLERPEPPRRRDGQAGADRRRRAVRPVGRLPPAAARPSVTIADAAACRAG